MWKFLIIMGCTFPFCSTSQDLQIQKLNLNKFIDEGLEINTFSLTEDGSAGFFTATDDWEHQIPFLVTFSPDTVVQQIQSLGTIYNGAISPSGNQIIYAIREGEYTTLHLVQKTSTGWTSSVELSASSNLMGGYFHWYNEEQLFFYTPENAGDLVEGLLDDGTLRITNHFEEINSAHTEFSPYVAPNYEYLIFTKYVKGDSTQQGLMISYNNGSASSQEWSVAKKIQNLRYGWGAFIKDDLLYFSDGISIYYTPFAPSGRR